MARSARRTRRPGSKATGDAIGKVKALIDKLGDYPKITSEITVSAEFIIISEFISRGVAFAFSVITWPLKNKLRVSAKMISEFIAGPSMLRPPRKDKKFELFVDNETYSDFIDKAGKSTTTGKISKRRANAVVRWLMHLFNMGETPRPNDAELKPYLDRAKKQARKPKPPTE